MSPKSPAGLELTKERKKLLFFYLEHRPDSNETTFNEWYENEHIPLYLQLPGINSAVRYKSIDSQGAPWLTLFTTSESDNVLQTRVVENENEALAKLGGVSKRTYVHSATFTHPTTELESLPCKYILVVTLEMKTAEAEEDMNRWYDEEHMDLLSKIPGWKQGRRYKLVESNQRGTMADKPVSQYLAIHEFTNSGFASTPEFKHATSTEWRERVMKNADRHARVFELKNKF